MRLVLLTRDAPEHRHVARRIAEAYPDSLQAIVLSKAGAVPLRTRLRRYVKRYSLPQILSRMANRAFVRLTRYRQRRRAALETILFGGQDDGRFDREDLVRVVPSLRGEACRTLLGELSPDYLLVYGTEIVKPETFQLASRGALNLHTGISPRYRGADCGFWALHNEEPEWIGSTVHMLDAGIDTGPILATVRPSIEASDDEHTLFAKCVRVGADTYVQSIEALRAGDGGARPQALSEGREYRSVDRTLRADLRVARLLRGGLLARYLERDDHPPA